MDSAQFRHVNRSMEFAKAPTTRVLSKLASPATSNAAGGFEFVAARDASVEPTDSLYQLMPLPEHNASSSQWRTLDKTDSAKVERQSEQQRALD